MKRSIRSRTVHLLATGRYTSPDEMFKRISNEGLPPDESSTDAYAKVVAVVEEVAFAHLTASLISNIRLETRREAPLGST